MVKRKPNTNGNGKPSENGNGRPRYVNIITEKAIIECLVQGALLDPDPENVEMAKAELRKSYPEVSGGHVIDGIMYAIINNKDVPFKEVFYTYAGQPTKPTDFELS